MGGALKADSYSDPEDASGYSGHDILSLGFKKSPKHMALVQDTKSIDDVNVANYEAVFVCGGQSPMLTFVGNERLRRLVSKFYEAGKVTALVCHGTSLLLETRLGNGDLLVKGKTWTGFADSEEEFADKVVGKRVQPFWIEEEARKIEGTNFLVARPFAPHAVRDGLLVTGQQQNSAGLAAELVIEALGVTAAPTGVKILGNNVSVTRFEHPFFRANAWLVANDENAVLIDTACNDLADGERLVSFVRASGRRLQAVILSHGHPDVWLGVRSLKEAFPSTPVFVASESIRDDVLRMAAIIEQGGMLASPELSAKNFDYRAAIDVLAAPTFRLEGTPSATLELAVTQRPSEHTRLTTVFVPELDALFVSDLAYNHVHSWAGIGVTRDALRNWGEQIERLVERYGRPGIRVMPGHGAETDANLLYAQRDYLRRLTAALDSGADGAGIVAEMKRSFPKFLGEAFQLQMTANNREALVGTPKAS